MRLTIRYSTTPLLTSALIESSCFLSRLFLAAVEFRPYKNEREEREGREEREREREREREMALQIGRSFLPFLPFWRQ